MKESYTTSSPSINDLKSGRLYHPNNYKFKSQIMYKQRLNTSVNRYDEWKQHNQIESISKAQTSVGLIYALNGSDMTK